MEVRKSICSSGVQFGAPQLELQLRNLIWSSGARFGAPVLDLELRNSIFWKSTLNLPGNFPRDPLRFLGIVLEIILEINLGRNGMSGMLCGALGRCGTLWDAVGCSGARWRALGRSGTLGRSWTLWEALGGAGTLWDALGLSQSTLSSAQNRKFNILVLNII